MESKSRAPKFNVPLERAIEHCRIIVDGKRMPGEYHTASALREVTEHENGFVWLALNDPSATQMERVAEEFGIHRLIAEDASSRHQRPKIERYDNQLFLVVRAVQFTDDEEVADTREVITTGDVQMVVGPKFIITIRHGASLPNIFAEMDTEPRMFAAGPISVAWRISDVLVDQYVHVTGLLEGEVDELEDEVFTPGSKISIDRIYLFRREILEMRHATDPLSEALATLLRDHKDLIPKQVRSYFRDVQDTELSVRDRIAGFDQRLASLIDASVAKITLQQNQDMRAISAFVGMAAVPTLIAGIYGMNFDNMPELHYRYGYFITLAVIVGIIAGLWYWFRRNGWL